jgi:hypothetical protein
MRDEHSREIPRRATRDFPALVPIAGPLIAVTAVRLMKTNEFIY